MTNRVSVHQFRAKLGFLRTDPGAQLIAGHTAGRPSFAAKMDLASSTVRDWLDETRQEVAAIESGHAVKIAAAFRFPPDWPSWRTGTCDEFRKAFAEHVRVLQKADSEPTLPVVRDATVPLMQGPDRDIVSSGIKLLASVELLCGQTGPGSSDIGAQVSCGRARIDTEQHRFTVAAALLEIDCGQARGDHTRVRGYDGQTLTIQGSAGPVLCRWADGNMQNLAWEIEAKGASIGSITIEPGLATLTRLAHGDVVTAKLGAWLKWIEPDDEAATAHRPDIRVVDPSGQPLDLPIDELSAVQTS